MNTSDIKLVEHIVVMEGVLCVHGGTLSPVAFLTWLGATRVGEMDRPGGNPAYVGN